MPLVAHNSLPTFERLREQGCQVLSSNAAQHQDIRALHVGLLNMMPDSALEATERQFFRLLDGANRVVQVHIHTFTLKSVPRGEDAQQHIASYYEDFEELKEQGLDGLIITGANVSEPKLHNEPFWDELCEIVDWAAENVTSVFCSCLASHAVWQHRYGLERHHMGDKCWGVFKHTIKPSNHPLINQVNTRVRVPHSRYNTVEPQRILDAGMRILIESEEVGVLFATSKDGFRFVFSQGHPEYDTMSLLKEYKREVLRFTRHERESYPPFVSNYLTLQSQAVLKEHELEVREAMQSGTAIPELPEAFIQERLHNDWANTAHVIMANWIGKVYLLTNADRKIPFMDGINPDNPFGLEL